MSRLSSATDAAGPILRFAPSPTGPLHLGHVYSALFCWREAERLGGVCLLRIEDIDPERCRPEYEAAIYEDLRWLGFSWPEPVLRQSEDQAPYQRALDRLADYTYPCFCSRKQIAAALSASGQAVIGPDGPHYPGTCRPLSSDERAARIARGERYALRLDVARAADAVGRAAGRLSWIDIDRGEIVADPAILGDPILARKDVPMSYHLCVVVDDARQGISHVTRGEDLREATHLHRLLQKLLDLPPPRYRFHGLIKNPDGSKLSKREGAMGISALRDRGLTPGDIIRMIEKEYRP